MEVQPCAWPFIGSWHIRWGGAERRFPLYAIAFSAWQGMKHHRCVWFDLLLWLNLFLPERSRTNHIYRHLPEPFEVKCQRVFTEEQLEEIFRWNGNKLTFGPDGEKWKKGQNFRGWRHARMAWRGVRLRRRKQESPREQLVQDSDRNIQHQPFVVHTGNNKIKNESTFTITFWAKDTVHFFPMLGPNLIFCGRGEF